MNIGDFVSYWKGKKFAAGRAAGQVRTRPSQLRKGEKRMSDKIKTEDCVKAICGHWDKAIDEGRPVPVGKYHGKASDLINPKNWKRVKKLGDAKDGFIRLFANVIVDEECKIAGEEAADKGRVDLSARIKWVMVVRATDDEVYDVCPGATIDGEFLEGDEFEKRLRAFGTPLSVVPTIVAAPAPKTESKKDEEVRERLSKVMGFKIASYEEMFGKGSASEPLEVDDEEAWQKVYGEDYKKFPTDAFGQPEPPADPLVPGGAIHLNVDKGSPAIERSSRKYIKFMEARHEEKFAKKKIKPGAVFLFLEPFCADVEDVLTFPKGGMAYIDFGEGEVCDDYSASDDLFLVDNVGNVWWAGGEPQDSTDRIDECWDGAGDAEYLKKAKEAIAKYKPTVVMRHM